MYSLPNSRSRGLRRKLFMTFEVFGVPPSGFQSPGELPGASPGGGLSSSPELYLEANGTH